MKEFNTVSLATQIIYTLMLSGPLLWLPINISRGNSKFIVLNIILSIISVILLIFSWRKYLKQTKKKTKGTIPLLISMIVGIILTLAIFAGVAKLQEVIFVPKDYLMFMFKPPYSYMIFLFEFEIIAILVSKIYKKVNNIEWEWAFELIKESSKENYEFCTFDQRYIDRFLRIVDNK